MKLKSISFNILFFSFFLLSTLTCSFDNALAIKHSVGARLGGGFRFGNVFSSYKAEPDQSQENKIYTKQGDEVGSIYQKSLFGEIVESKAVFYSNIDTKVPAVEYEYDYELQSINFKGHYALYDNKGNRAYSSLGDTSYGYNMAEVPILTFSEAEAALNPNNSLETPVSEITDDMKWKLAISGSESIFIYADIDNYDSGKNKYVSSLRASASAMGSGVSLQYFFAEDGSVPTSSSTYGVSQVKIESSNSQESVFIQSASGEKRVMVGYGSNISEYNQYAILKDSIVNKEFISTISKIPGFFSSGVSSLSHWNTVIYQDVGVEDNIMLRESYIEALSRLLGKDKGDIDLNNYKTFGDIYREIFEEVNLYNEDEAVQVYDGVSMVNENFSQDNSFSSFFNGFSLRIGYGVDYIDSNGVVHQDYGMLRGSDNVNNLIDSSSDNYTLRTPLSDSVAYPDPSLIDTYEDDFIQYPSYSLDNYYNEINSFLNTGVFYKVNLGVDEKISLMTIVSSNLYLGNLSNDYLSYNIDALIHIGYDFSLNQSTSLSIRGIIGYVSLINDSDIYQISDNALVNQSLNGISFGIGLGIAPKKGHVAWYLDFLVPFYFDDFYTGNFVSVPQYFDQYYDLNDVGSSFILSPKLISGIEIFW